MENWWPHGRAAWLAFLTGLLASAMMTGYGSSSSQAGFDLATYASTHQSVPESLLKSSGLGTEYRKMPFICGTSTLMMVADYRKSTATMPADVQKELMDRLHEDINRQPPPDPEYVVDLTRVEDVTVSRFGAHQIVVLRHPAKSDPNGYFRQHLPLTSRLLLDGHGLRGAGPVSIWQDGRLLFFTDEPWMLIDWRPEGPPILLRAFDHYRSDGPIEVDAETPPIGSPVIGETWFLDAEMTGASFRLIPQHGESSRVIFRVVRVLNGSEKDWGALTLDANGQLRWIEEPERTPFGDCQ